VTPEARAKAIAELEAMEQNPPTLPLSDEEIAQLEQEKHDLALGFVKPKSDAGRIRGEGSAVEDGPVVAPDFRPTPAAALVPLRRPDFDPPWQVAGTRPHPPRELGNIDAAVLARLIEAAKGASELARQARSYVEHAESEARATRTELDEYMVEHGLR
jgi:hypothetical protein